MINTEVRERILLARMDGSEEIETDLEFWEIRMQKCEQTFEATVSTLKMGNVFHGR